MCVCVCVCVCVHVVPPRSPTQYRRQSKYSKGEPEGPGSGQITSSDDESATLRNLFIAQILQHRATTPPAWESVPERAKYAKIMLRSAILLAPRVHHTPEARALWCWW